MKLNKRTMNCKIFFEKALLGLSIFAISFFASCGSTKVVETVQAEQVEDFTRRQLSNGIPVVFKQNRGSKIVVFKLVFEGGTSAIDKSIGGIENLTLDLALRGTETYSYKTISQLQYEKSFSFISSSEKDYATAGFICIQRDMAEVLKIFSDCLLNPLFAESDYDQKMAEIAASIASKKADPSGALSLALTKAAFEDHPYLATSYVTDESYSNINLTLVKGIHQGLLNALRIKIVVVGNFTKELMDDFMDSLEKDYGSLSRKVFSLPKIPKISVGAGAAIRVANEQAGNTGYIAGFFECPSRDSADYIPFAIATMYVDELFFSQVREKAGAVYSINTGVIGGKELVGVIAAYKATEKKQMKKLILDAISSFDANHLAKYLEQYKNKYITSIFNSAQTASGISNSVVTSMEYFGSESAYLSRAEQVQSVETLQVIEAYKKYIAPIAKENAASWVIVDGEENLSEYDF